MYKQNCTSFVDHVVLDENKTWYEIGFWNVMIRSNNKMTLRKI